MKQQHRNKTVLYPVFLTLFILFILFIFFFGENGLLIHKEKIKKIKTLKKDNKELYNKVYSLDKRITLLKDNNPLYLEEEARALFLKKNGDTIIKVFHSRWIEDLARQYEEFYEKEFDKSIEEETNDSYQGELLIGLLINVFVALILTIIIPFNKN